VIRCKELLKVAASELEEKGVDFDPHIETGIMVEVPSIVLVAEHVAKLVDFFSIGTNDLIQYTLAVDRGNERIASLYTNYHPAVLKLIKQTVEVAHRNNIWTGLCGEMAGDPIMVPFLVGLGLDELSVTPTILPEVKELIRSIRYNSAKRLIDETLQYTTASEVKNKLVTYLKKELPHISDVLLTDEDKRISE
jgi:phosphotransferase system enzyme I (PtsI)